MSWESRGRQRVYYRSRRIGNTVRKVYFGAGQAAKEAAVRDAAAKAKRATDAAELVDFQAKLAGLDEVVAEVETGVDLLSEATLLGLGFHDHRGEWRRRPGLGVPS